jgi:hypothetical protein
MAVQMTCMYYASITSSATLEASHSALSMRVIILTIKAGSSIIKFSNSGRCNTKPSQATSRIATSTIRNLHRLSHNT